MNRGPALGAATGLLTAGLVVTGCGASAPATAMPAATPARTSGQIPAIGTALISLTGSCSLEWVSQFEIAVPVTILPDTPAGYQQVQAAENGMSPVIYVPGFSVELVNGTSAPVVITSVTVGQSFPDGATEPDAVFQLPGGPALLEPGQSLDETGRFIDGQVVNGGSLFTVSASVFEAGSCTASFQEGD